MKTIRQCYKNAASPCQNAMSTLHLDSGILNLFLNEALFKQKETRCTTMPDSSHQAIATTAPSAIALEEVPNKIESGIEKPGNTSDASNVNDEDEYASGISLLLLIISLMLGMFLVALDNVCI
jgi:hypothetical protein